MLSESERACFGQLMALCDVVATIDPHVVSHAVDEALSCECRHRCPSHLACSWLVSDLATRLMDRFAEPPAVYDTVA